VTTPQSEIRALVVDAEPMARRSLRTLLDAETGIECVGESWGREAVAAIEEAAPDLVFLDVQMPGMNGFEVLDRLADDRVPLVVFVTAFDEYAVRAFEVRAIDYLVKPFTDDRFRDVVERARERVAQRATPDGRRRLGRRAAEHAGRRGAGGAGEDPAEVDSVRRGGSGAGGNRIIIRGVGRSLVVRHSEIDWLEGVGSYVRVHAGETHRLIRASLTELTRSLDPASFFRIHRSSIVNLERIREIEAIGHGDALLRLEDGTELRVSRSRREAFERALEG
jgi:two-component system LytT family response regulator